MVAPVVIPVKLDGSDAAQQAGNLNNVIGGKIALGIGAAAAAAFTLKKGLDLVSQGLRSATRYVKESITLAGTQIEAERRLIRALELRGENTAGALEEIQKFNRAVQQSTGIGDELLLSLQSQGVQLGLNRDEIKLATKAAIGWADATGKNVGKAMQDAIKVIQGNILPIKRYNSELQSVGETLKFMSLGFDQATERTDELAGQMKLAGANMGDVKEELGRIVAEAPAVVDLFRDINEQILDLGHWIADNKDGISDWLGRIVDNIRGAAEGISDFMDRKERFDAAQTSVTGRWLNPQDDLFQGPTISKGQLARIKREREDVLKLEATATRRSEEIEAKAAEKRDREAARSLAKELAASQKRDRERSAAATRRREAARKRDIDGLKSQFDGEMAMRDHRQRKLEHFNSMEARLENDRRKVRKDNLSIEKRDLETRSELFADLTGLIGGAISTQVSALAQGQASVREALGGIIGGIITGFGTMLIQLGSAALAASVLSLFPIFAPLVGAPGTLALAGAGLLAAGAGIVAAGSAMGGAISGGASRGSASGGGGGRAERAETARERARADVRVQGVWQRRTSDAQASGSLAGEVGGRHLTINFPPGTIITDTKRQLGRALGDIIRSSDALSMGMTRGLAHGR